MFGVGPLCTFSRALQPDWGELGEEELEFTFSSLAYPLRRPPGHRVGPLWASSFCPPASPWVVHSWPSQTFPRAEAGAEGVPAAILGEKSIEGDSIKTLIRS